MLELLLNLDVTFNSDEDSARSAYKALIPEGSTEPDFDTLLKNGWLQIIWGRISTPFEVARAAQTSGLSALNALMKDRFEEHFHVADQANKIPELAPIIESINYGETTPYKISCESPEWVAARLWERIEKDPINMNTVLRFWVDRWRLLGFPSLIPSIVWPEPEFLIFKEAVYELLKSSAGLLGWEELRARFIMEISLTSGRSSADLGNFIPEIPNTLIERSLWVENINVKQLIMDIFRSSTEVLSLAGLLLTDIEKTDYGPAPHPQAMEFFALATKQPELLHLLLFRLRATPALLADVLLNPETSALGCLIVGEWQYPGGAWDRELTNRDSEETKAIAFADAASLMGWFLQQGSLPSAEAAALLKWVHKKAGPGFIDDQVGTGSMRSVICAELIGQSPETLRAMVSDLTATMPESGLGTPDFAAILDIIELGKLASKIDASRIINAYQFSLATLDYPFDTNRIGLSGAAILYELSVSNTNLQKKFLYPIDINAGLGDEQEENPLIREDRLCKALRAHIRTLSRSIAGLSKPVPNDLVDALIVAVKSGAFKHTEKNRIPAFAPRFESNGFGVPIDRPIGADLGGALSSLEDERCGKLLNAILETDEPLVLAQMANFAPRKLLTRIKARAEEILPADAGRTYTLREEQARIEAMLSAGFIQGAVRFMENEEGLRTMGPVSGRDLTRFQSQLRLLLLKNDWSGIASLTVPEELAQHENAVASETLDFFKALAALHDPNGDRMEAEELFVRLQNKRPDNVAYVINLFAARISHILAKNLFAELTDADLVRGRQVLLEAENMIRRAQSVTPDESTIFNTNKALLLLALREPQKAIELLTRLRTIRLNDRVAAYTAVALARVGHRPEAIAVVDQAKSDLGESAVLTAALAYIQTNKPFIATPNTTIENDRLEQIKRAFWDLMQMDHERQAEVFSPPPNAFPSFVIDQVRFAAASLTSLVPMLGTDNVPREDDLNSIIRELLTARFHFLKWAVPDQSLGGYSPAYNPGERDLILKRDSAELAVIEAVICNKSISRKNLRIHFQKLFAYSQCRLFFHLTYTYLQDRKSKLIQVLKEIARKDAPDSFEYTNIENISSIDSRPDGFIARYISDRDEVNIVFLVLDMGQNTQKKIAKMSRVG